MLTFEDRPLQHNSSCTCHDGKENGGFFFPCPVLYIYNQALCFNMSECVGGKSKEHILYYLVLLQVVIHYRGRLGMQDGKSKILTWRQDEFLSSAQNALMSQTGWAMDHGFQW